MLTYVLDTNIIIGYVRAAPYAQHVEREYKLFDPSNISVISIVSVGEIYSIALQRQWEDKKMQTLAELLSKIPTVDINHNEIIHQYAEIDAFSQGKGKIKLPSGLSARNMGKNDLWIAATASQLKAPLLTTDADFEHLNSSFITVIRIDPALK